MILGIGADILEISRLDKAIKVSPTLLPRLFTEKEILRAQKLSVSKRNAYYAKRFAAKEAFSKACGTGIGADISWQDIEILNDKNGKPVSKISPKALRFLQKKFKTTKKVSCFLSLSDEKKYALAFIILTI